VKSCLEEIWISTIRIARLKVAFGFGLDHVSFIGKEIRAALRLNLRGSSISAHWLLSRSP
jgi:hypothetical protein